MVRGAGRCWRTVSAGGLAALVLAGCGGPGDRVDAAASARATPSADSTVWATPPASTAASAPSAATSSDQARAADPTPDPTARALACVAELPTDVRIGQTMLVTSPSLSRITGWLHDGLIAGALANGTIGVALAAAYRQAVEDTRYGALLAVDEEGGQVQRYQALIGTFPSERTQSATMTTQQVRTLYRRVGEDLADWGIDLVLAPVADVGHGPGIGSRSYSADPAVAARYTAAAAAGLADAGQIPVVKHFPGHGRASGDSHDGPVVGPSIDELRRVDLQPFERAIEKVPQAAIMVGHTTIPGYSALPSSQSRAVVDGLLRDELGLGERLVVSDALGMAASGADDQGDALVRFLAAGGDLGIIGPYGSVQGRRAVKAALGSGDLTWERVDEAAVRVFAAKGLDPCSLTDGPAPSVPVEAGPSDAPVVNPTSQ